MQLLHIEQERLNREWPDTIGDELLRLQGDARMARKLLRMILQQPS